MGWVWALGLGISLSRLTDRTMSKYGSISLRLGTTTYVEGEMGKGREGKGRGGEGRRERARCVEELEDGIHMQERHHGSWLMAHGCVFRTLKPSAPLRSRTTYPPTASSFRLADWLAGWLAEGARERCFCLRLALCRRSVDILRHTYGTYFFTCIPAPDATLRAHCP